MADGESQNLEERVNNTPARVLILDDNPKDLGLITRALNKKGKLDKLRVEGTTSVDEARKLLVDNNRYWVVVSDINLGGKDGSDFVREIKDARGDSLDAILMSGVVVDGFHITSLAKNIRYVSGTWEKDLSNVGIIYDMIRGIVSKRQLEFPKFPRVYILAGARGAGKDSNARILKQMPYVYATSPPTTRKPLRPSDVPDLSIPARYQRIHRDFLSNDEMRERVRRTENPLTWGEDGPVIAKGSYLKLDDASLNERNFYMLDLGELETKLAEGDVIVPIRNISALRALKRFFAERCHVILLDAGTSSRSERIASEGRPALERGRIGKERNEQQFHYLLQADTVIKSDLAFPIEYAGEDKLLRIEAINHTSGRISDLIKRLRETPYSVSASEIHAEYVRDVLCALVGTNKLAKGSEIEIPREIRDDFQTANSKEPDKFLSLIPRVSPARVDELVDENYVIVASLRAAELYSKSSDFETGRPWSDVLERLIEYHLEKKKLRPSQKSTIFPAKLFFYPQQVEHRLVYAQTDAPPHLAKGEPAKPYRLELVFE